MTLDDGPIVIPVDNIRQMLADCYWWRRIADPDNPWDDETALSHTYEDCLPIPPNNQEDYTAADLSALRPYALVSDGEFAINTVSANSSCLRPNGELIISIRLEVPEEHATDDSGLGRYIRQTIGKVIQTGNVDQPGLMDLAGLPDRLFIQRLRVMPYERIPEKFKENQGDYVIVDVMLEWGFDR